jgi:hypothetical protein
MPERARRLIRDEIKGMLEKAVVLSVMQCTSGAYCHMQIIR